VFDESGRYLLLHHQSAQKYYKFNMLFVSLFFGISVYNSKKHPELFFNSRLLAKLYLGCFTGAILLMYMFSNRHIKNLYLLKCGKKIEIETYSNFGLTYNRMRQVPIESLQGNRLFSTKSMNLYQLEYTAESSWGPRITRHKSFFYRP
jgi:hypothetical protein